jgi:hypothetical protein
VRIEVNNGDVVALLTNRSDQPVFVNTNFGGSMPFADGRWAFESGSTQREFSIGAKSNESWHSFRGEKLVEVAPGETLELARTSRASLLDGLKRAGLIAVPKDGMIHFSYSNNCDRRWQARQGSALQDDKKLPSVLRDPLPRRTLSSRLSSNRLPIGALE